LNKKIKSEEEEEKKIFMKNTPTSESWRRLRYQKSNYLEKH